MDNKTDILASFNSPAIEKRLSEIRDRKGKNAFLESIMSNLNAEVLNETNGHKTILFSGNKGPKTILLNNYGKALNISRKEFKTGIYKKRIRGFL